MKNLMLFKNTDKKTDKQPDYRVVTTIDDNLVTVGGGWIREGKAGKFVSIALQDAKEFEYEGIKKAVKGYKLVEERQETPIKPLPQENNQQVEINADDIPW